MKPILIMLAIVAIIWALNGVTCSFIENSSEKMLNELGSIRQAVQANDLGAADSGIDSLRKDWVSMESRWEVIVDHREVDRIDTLMTHLQGMAKAGTIDTMMPELDELAFFFEHIDDKHRIKAENIL